MLQRSSFAPSKKSLGVLVYIYWLAPSIVVVTALHRALWRICKNKVICVLGHCGVDTSHVRTVGIWGRLGVFFVCSPPSWSRRRSIRVLSIESLFCEREKRFFWTVYIKLFPNTQSCCGSQFFKLCPWIYKQCLHGYTSDSYSTALVDRDKSGVEPAEVPSRQGGIPRRWRLLLFFQFGFSNKQYYLSEIPHVTTLISSQHKNKETPQEIESWLARLRLSNYNVLLPFQTHAPLTINFDHPKLKTAEVTQPG